ncbi:PTS sugar transporter subunit IIA [Chromobacterium subtsugae]|uniref:PTS sugar transporter subunit IIA n=1 Tax=Chromobacterium subtsugae TaxID=251747 RepID=A0ABS7F7H4_9NEIS|nr:MULTISPECIES: PTS sugar transporter subunit IIA [Chromobacterium]KUM03098.1 hypothetical protein Cv017_21480 [Chromobacterium subtsugae]KZE86153.1 hypothetical protein AWB61_16585 [Chromobacterium sp. F49]MBW7568833.1 PTS sugar transporter subunit IIA [Chromobacterium subtsugae]MBW8286034.1 PTS sugar transporter subunit IIA [Chromobacterium subtsugae]WSE91909.1 PTS sugar transporter subunit IIA [Chromobacterium subtsugae]
MESLPDLCRVSDILLDVDVDCKNQLFAYAARQLGQRHALNSQTVQSALQLREQTGSTALGHGLALPHARIPGLSEAHALFLRLKRDMEFDSPDGKPVRSLLLLLLPQEAHPQHLQLLAAIARMCSERPFREALARCAHPQQVHQLFQLWADPQPSNDPHFWLDSNRYFLDTEASLRPDYSIRRKVVARF